MRLACPHWEERRDTLLSVGKGNERYPSAQVYQLTLQRTNLFIIFVRVLAVAPAPETGAAHDPDFRKMTTVSLTAAHSRLGPSPTDWENTFTTHLFTNLATLLYCTYLQSIGTAKFMPLPHVKTAQRDD